MKTIILSDWNTLLWLAYWGFFIVLAGLARAWGWLWCSVMLWALTYLAGLWWLPEWFRFPQWNLWVPPYAYITVVSLVFLFGRSWRRRPTFWRSFAGWFAISAWLLTLADGLLLGAAWFRYPDMFSAYMLPALWGFYGWSIAVWWLAQMLLTGMFYVHQRWNDEAVPGGSWLRLQVGFLYAVVVQAVVVFSMLRDITR